MKIKNLIAAALFSVALCACQQAKATGTINETPNQESQDWLNIDWAEYPFDGFNLFEDKETGVQYILWHNNGGAALIPRYNSDGTFYVREEAK